MKKFWNEGYWRKSFDEHENLDFMTDIWLDKHDHVINDETDKKALDLGCGLGQYSYYLMRKGFDVTASYYSEMVLNKLNENIPEVNTICLDMGGNLPFKTNEFDVIVANLSIHYFNEDTTIKLMNEIYRVLKPNGYFIGTVNSSKILKSIKSWAIELEPNYYADKDRNFRLFSKEQFNQFFNSFEFEHLDEVTIKRWERKKIMWEFIAKPKSLVRI